MESLSVKAYPCEESPNIEIVELSGDLTFETIGELTRCFSRILEGERFYVVGEMSRVSSVSSAAIGELMGCRTGLIDKGGDLVLAGMELGVRERLIALDANRIFGFHPDTRTAVNAYNWKYQDGSETVTVTFPSVLTFVPAVRQLVCRIAGQKGYSGKDAFRIETIVDEVCNNAVEHGANEEDGEIEVTVTIDRKKIEIKTVNAGDPEKVHLFKEISKSLALTPPAGLDDMRDRGLAVVRMLSNDFRIESSDVGTCVCVTKLREE